MPKKSALDIKRWGSAFVFSWKGFRAAWTHEASFRQELFMLLVLVPAAFWVGETAAQRALLIFSAMATLVVELLNSAVEALADRHGPERHPLSGRAKDLGSAAVLVSLVMTALVWGLIAWERWF